MAGMFLGGQGQQFHVQGPMIGNACAVDPDRSKSQKGNGKGKQGGGKGSPGPQQPPPPPPPPQGEWIRVKERWKCGWKDCQSGLNNAPNTSCYKCLRPKALAKNPPPYAAKEAKAPVVQQPAASPPAQSPNGATAKERKAQKKKEKRAAKRSERNAQKPAAATPKAPAGAAAMAVDVDSDDDDLEATLANDEVAILKKLGMQPIVAAATLETTFSKPNPQECTKTPEEVVATACGQNDTLTEAQANVDFYLRELAAIEGVESKALMIPVIKKALLDATEKVASMPTGKTLSMVGLQAKKTTAMEVEEKRVNTSNANREKALARFNRYEAVVKSQQELLQSRLESLRTAFTATASAWNDTEQELSKAHTARMAAWDSRIAAADNAAGGHLASMNVPTPQSELAMVTPPVVLTPPSAPTSTHPADCYLAVGWTAEDLPHLNRDLSDSEEQVLSVVMSNVRAWQCNGTIPASYKMLATGLQCAKGEVMEAFRQIVGIKIWTAFYGERKVTASDYVPAQLGYIIREALDRVRETLTQSKYAKQTSETAGRVFTEHLQADTKRRKAAKTPFPAEEADKEL